MGPNDKVMVLAVCGFLSESAFYTIVFLLFENSLIGDALSAGLFLTFLRRLYFFQKKVDDFNCYSRGWSSTTAGFVALASQG